MAIIIPIVSARSARPMLRIVDGQPEVTDPAGWWGPKLAAAGNRIAAAIRGVARLDTPGAVLPFVGTAFAVAPRLAVTANYVGDALATRARDLPPGQVLAQLDFADEPSGEGCVVAVKRVEMIHPVWKSAFLVLAEDVPPDRIVRLAPAASGPDLVGREICVIGYPSHDPRNEASVLDRILAGPRDVKRVMPGKVTGWEVGPGSDPAPMIVHDASTTAGTGGAPLVDLTDGFVFGLQHSGSYLQQNFAAAAWELTRDPQWARLWGGAQETQTETPVQMAERALVIQPESVPSAVFPHSRLLTLVDLLIANRFDDLEDVSLLLLGLPPEMVATLPQPDNARARLAACLNELNRMTFVLGEDVPIYYVLINAEHNRTYDPQFKQALSPYLDGAIALRGK